MATTFNYREYLASREWALLKNLIRERSGGTCERCHQAPHQSTHHMTYERIGHERPDDLLGVCNPCHAYLSGKSDHDPSVSPKAAKETEGYLVLDVPRGEDLACVARIMDALFDLLMPVFSQDGYQVFVYFPGHRGASFKLQLFGIRISYGQTLEENLQTLLGPGNVHLVL